MTAPGITVGTHDMSGRSGTYRSAEVPFPSGSSSTNARSSGVGGRAVTDALWPDSGATANIVTFADRSVFPLSNPSSTVGRPARCGPTAVLGNRVLSSWFGYSVDQVDQWNRQAESSMGEVSPSSGLIAWWNCLAASAWSASVVSLLEIMTWSSIT